MAPRIHDHLKRAPSKRLQRSVRGYFFPGEAARILGLEGIDYHQLRRILKIASGPKAPAIPSRKWTRFTFKDLLMVRTAIDLAGGIDALKKHRHLRLKKVQLACTALRERFGITDPLASMNLRLEGGSIVAHLDGVTFEPGTGQTVLEIDQGIHREIAKIEDHFRKRLASDADSLRANPGVSKPSHRTMLPIR